MKTKQEHIDEVMDQFDFGRVAKAMKVLDWKWVNAEEGVPQEWELRQEARRLLNLAYDGAIEFNVSPYTTWTGGFEATYSKEWDDLGLKFIVASWLTGDF
jgi:hypothetical protein